MKTVGMLMGQVAARVATKRAFLLSTDGDLTGLMAVPSTKGWFTQGGSNADPSGGPYDDAEVMKQARRALTDEGDYNCSLGRCTLEDCEVWDDPTSYKFDAQVRAWLADGLDEYGNGPDYCPMCGVTPCMGEPDCDGDC